MHARGFWLASLCLAVACVRTEPSLDASRMEADATFVAHSVHAGLAVDRSTAVPMTRIDARSTFGRGPTFVVRDDDAKLAGLWLVAPATVVARTSLAAAAPPAVHVRPDWVEQAIRFSIETDGGRFRIGPFARADGRAGMSTLSRTGQTNLDIRGVYRATIVDVAGARVGWFQVVAPSPDEPRVFQGRLPATSLAMGPALAVALASELDWIEAHSLDVYRGTGRERGTVTPAR